MSEVQRKKLSEAQKRYISSDPHWEAHRTKLSQAMTEYTATDPRFPEHCRAASERQRRKLFQEEITAAQNLPQRGCNFEYVSEILCVSTEVLRRELKANGVDTTPARPDKRAKPGKGPWRCFEDASPSYSPPFLEGERSA
jgi:hypothetical protein